MGSDTVLLSLAGGIGAALVGLIGIVVGNAIGSRNELRKWLRDRRHEAYVAFVAAADKWSIRMSDRNDDDVDPPEFFDEMSAAEAAVDLAGPPSVVAAMEPIRGKILDWAHRPDSSRGQYAMEYWNLQRAFVAEAQSALASKRDRRQKPVTRP